MNIKRMRLVAITALAVLLVALPASITEQDLAQVHAAMLGAVRVASSAGASRATFVAPGSAKRNASSSSHEESGMEDEAEIELRALPGGVSITPSQTTFRVFRSERRGDRGRHLRALAPNSPKVRKTLTGLDVTAGGGFTPADSEVAAGAGEVVEVVNDAVSVWTNDGVSRGVRSLATLFNRSDLFTDPSVVYDASSGHWFASSLDLTDGGVHIAMTDTSDAAGGWWNWTTTLPDCLDQPRIAVSASLVGIGGYAFTHCQGGTALGGQTVVWNKQELLAKGDAHYRYSGPNPSYGPFIPARGGEGAGSLAFVGPTASPALVLLTTSGAPPVVQSSSSFVGIRTLTNPPPAEQRGSSIPVATNDFRFLSAYWQGGRLWLAGNDGCLPAGDTAARACLRLTQVVNGVAVQDSDLYFGNAQVYFPALAPEASGSAVVVFGFSSSSDYPSVAAVAVRPDGSFSPSVVLSVGRAPQTSQRYGDYFGAAPQPDDSSFVWTSAEIGLAIGGNTNGWGTVVTKLSLTAMPPPPNPPRSSDTRPPKVRALAGTYRPGARVELDYRVRDNSGESREVNKVYTASGRTLATIPTRFSDRSDGGIFYVIWRAPKTVKGTLRHCVRAWDRAGNASGLSCAPLRER